MYRLTSNIRVKLVQKYGETIYCIAQFPTGYGDSYRQYLLCFSLDDSPNCPRYGGMERRDLNRR